MKEISLNSSQKLLLRREVSLGLFLPIRRYCIEDLISATAGASAIRIKRYQVFIGLGYDSLYREQGFEQCLLSFFLFSTGNRKFDEVISKTQGNLFLCY
jgi:hypothetical protein